MNYNAATILVIKTTIFYLFDKKVFFTIFKLKRFNLSFCKRHFNYSAALTALSKCNNNNYWSLQFFVWKPQTITYFFSIFSLNLIFNFFKILQVHPCFRQEQTSHVKNPSGCCGSTYNSIPSDFVVKRSDIFDTASAFPDAHDTLFLVARAISMQAGRKTIPRFINKINAS